MKKCVLRRIIRCKYWEANFDGKRTIDADKPTSAAGRQQLSIMKNRNSTKRLKT